MEREENAEECRISLRLGRSVAPLLHYFAPTVSSVVCYFSLSVTDYSNEILISPEGDCGFIQREAKNTHITLLYNLIIYG